MPSIKTIALASLVNLMITPAFATDACCKKMGGINYCDSSAGRLVCNNGFYSACYCTRHAVMDLQLLKGCCLWHGGVKPTYDNTAIVLCNDGSISEECALVTPSQSIGAW